ncbi:MAG: NAD-dependent epimerase/dehydratase family protein, partial [Gaiellaceae bacterium]
MSKHLIVGAGPVGSATARLLADEGESVLLVSRSGSGPDDVRIEKIAADAADRATVLRLAIGASAVYNCANPAYHRWPTDWPPIASSLLQAAKECNAVLVTMSNLYGYGPVDHPLTERDELAARGVKGRVRAQMWEEAKAAHDAGQVRVSEARASDFFGPGESASHFGRMIPRLLAGKTVRVIGSPDMPHSWTYVPDVARTLVTLARDERAWGRPWHVPTNP